MTAHVTWAKGGEAWVLAASQDSIVLRSTVPSPPGSRIEGVLVPVEAPAPSASGAGASEGALVGAAAPLRVKVHGSRRQDDGTFRLHGRPLDLTREVRARLEALAGASGEA